MDDIDIVSENKYRDTQRAAVPVSEHLIMLRGLCKSFRNGGVSIDILKEVSFDLNAGETVAVVGPSGIGKSTFLHILGTLDRPDSGTLLFRGDNVFLFEDVELARFRNESIGFIFQFHHLLPEFSAVENVMIPFAAHYSKPFIVTTGNH